MIVRDIPPERSAEEIGQEFRGLLSTIANCDSNTRMGAQAMSRAHRMLDRLLEMAAGPPPGARGAAAEPVPKRALGIIEGMQP